MILRRLSRLLSRRTAAAPTPSQVLHTRLGSVWNRYIPACAVHVEMNADHVRYLHPRKGWRRVSKARLGIS